MREEFEEILQYWFGDLVDGFASEDRNKLWWAGGEEADRTIASLFGRQVHQALAGELDHWAEHPRGRLALIILLDQFTRTLFRGEAEAFSGDNKALDLCEQGLKLKHDQALETAERIFFCMPLEHAEDMAAQDQCVAYFEQMFAETPLQHKGKVQSTVDFAHQHRDVIEQFGRFPHRNRALGRQSTPEELAHLNSNHNNWGQ